MHYVPLYTYSRVWCWRRTHMVSQLCTCVHGIYRKLSTYYSKCRRQKHILIETLRLTVVNCQDWYNYEYPYMYNLKKLYSLITYCCLLFFSDLFWIMASFQLFQNKKCFSFNKLLGKVIPVCSIILRVWCYFDDYLHYIVYHNYFGQDNRDMTLSFGPMPTSDHRCCQINLIWIF